MAQRIAGAWRVEMKFAMNIWEHFGTLGDILLKGLKIKAEDIHLPDMATR
jgi:hypothetical protein